MHAGGYGGAGEAIIGALKWAGGIDHREGAGRAQRLFCHCSPIQCDRFGPTRCESGGEGLPATAIARPDHDSEIGGRDQSFDEPAAEPAGAADHQDPLVHCPAGAGSSKTKRARNSGVGTMQVSARPNRRYRRRAIQS